MYISPNRTPAVTRRQNIELKIMKAAVKALLDANFSLSVYDGGEHLLVLPGGGGSGLTVRILDALYNTDEDYLNVWEGRTHIGWVRFVYGNDGWDVIADYTTNLEPYVGAGSEAQKISDKYAD